jgi:hypothetical protein
VETAPPPESFLDRHIDQPDRLARRIDRLRLRETAHLVGRHRKGGVGIRSGLNNRS